MTQRISMVVYCIRCGHGYHVECLEAWLKEHPNCPLSRTPVSGSYDRDNTTHNHNLYLKKFYDMVSRLAPVPWKPCRLHRVLVRGGHGYHVECLEAWLKEHPNCPLYRTPVSGSHDQDNTTHNQNLYLKKFYDMMHNEYGFISTCIMISVGIFLLQNLHNDSAYVSSITSSIKSWLLKHSSTSPHAHHNMTVKELTVNFSRTDCMVCLSEVVMDAAQVAGPVLTVEEADDSTHFTVKDSEPVLPVQEADVSTHLNDDGREVVIRSRRKRAKTNIDTISGIVTKDVISENVSGIVAMKHDKSPSMCTRSKQRQDGTGDKVCHIGKETKNIGMTINGVPSKLGFYVVDSLDVKKMELKVVNGGIPITTESIHKLLGLQMGGLDILEMDEVDDSKNITATWRKQFEKKKMRPKDIMKLIQNSGDAGFIFKLNFLVLFVNLMVECNRMGCCNFGFLSRIESEDVIPEIDWCKYIYRKIKTSKSRWRRDSTMCFYAGPLTYLTLLYVDSTISTKVVVDHKGYAISVWNLDLLKKRQSTEIKDGGFGLLPLRSTTESREDIHPRNASKQENTGETSTLNKE
ncbi:Zinc finger, RING/FYVE/PHD-type, partial [Cynara cardunculus var. scolymus]